MRVIQARISATGGLQLAHRQAGLRRHARERRPPLLGRHDGGRPRVRAAAGEHLGAGRGDGGVVVDELAQQQQIHRVAEPVVGPAAGRGPGERVERLRHVVPQRQALDLVRPGDAEALQAGNAGVAALPKSIQNGYVSAIPMEREGRGEPVSAPFRIVSWDRQLRATRRTSSPGSSAPPWRAAWGASRRRRPAPRRGTRGCRSDRPARAAPAREAARSPGSPSCR